MIAPGTPRHVPQRAAAGGEGRESRPPRGRRPPRNRHAASNAPGGPQQNSQTEAGGQPAGQPGHEAGAGDHAAAASAGSGAGSVSQRDTSRSGGRPQYSGGKPQYKRHQGRPNQQQRPHSRPKPKPKPLIPITKAMIEGKEPLRTFSDLLQFVKRQDEPEESVALASKSGQQSSADPSSEIPLGTAENGSQGAPSDAQESEPAEQTASHVPESTPTTG